MKPNEEKVTKQLTSIIEKVTAGRVNLIKLEPELFFIDDLGLYSIEILEIIFELEVLWGVTIKDDDISRLRTVGEVTAYIMEFVSTEN